MTFMRPEALALLLLLPVFVWFHRSVRRTTGAAAPWQPLVLRLLLLALLAGALARPVVEWEEEAMVRVVVVDVSESMGELGEVQAAVDRLVQEAPPGETVRLVAFADAPREIPAEPRQQRRFPPLTRSGFQTDASRIEDALDLALTLIPEGVSGAVTLLSDGRESRGAVRDAAFRLGSRRIPLDVVGMGVLAPHPVLLETRLPCQAPVGVPLAIQVRVESAADGTVQARLRGVEPETPARSVAVSLRNGRGQAEILHEVEAAGLNELHLALLDDRGMEIPGTGQRLAVHGLPPRTVWLVESREAPSVQQEVQTLLGPGAEVECVPAGSWSGTRDLDGVDYLILADVPASSLEPAAVRDVAVAVEEGMGLLVAGGERSFGPGGYGGTLLEKLLPVRFQQKEERRDPSATLVIIIDTSGSMTGTRIQLAKEVSRLALRRLKPHDKAGIVEFHGAKRWAAPIQSASNAVDLQRALNRLNAGGGTVILPAIEEAYYGLLNVRTRTRHVLVLTDGGVEQGAFEPLIRKMADRGMTLSTVLVGPGTHSAFLVSLSQWGRGRYYHCPDRFNMPEVIVKQPESSLLTPILEEPTSIRVAGDSFLGREGVVQPALKLHGLLEVEARPTADVLLETGRGEPLLCRWRYGLGQVSAWMSQLSGPWSRDLAGHEGYARLITGLFREGCRYRRPGRVSLRAIGVRDRLSVFAWQEPGGEALSCLQVCVEEEAGVEGQGHFERILTRGEGSGMDAPRGIVFKGVAEGVTTVSALDPEGEEQARGALALQGETEWGRSRVDHELLEKLAARTGGRVGSERWPSPPPPQKRIQGRELWRTFLWGAVAVLLLLVLIRRLSGRSAPAAVFLLVLVGAGPMSAQEPPETPLPQAVLLHLKTAIEEPYSPAGMRALTEAVRGIRLRDGSMEALLSHLEKRAGKDPRASLVLARTASMDGSPDRACAILEKLDTGGRLDGGGLAEYGRILETLGREDEALAVLDRALKSVRNPGLTIALRVRKASLLLSRPGEDSREGLVPLRRILADHPDSADLAFYVAFLAALHGRADLFEGTRVRQDTGKTACQEHQIRGTLHLRSGKHEKAQHHFLRALDAAPLMRDRRYAQERLISSHRIAGTLDALCNRWLADEKRTPVRVDALVAVLRELKRPEEALGLLLIGEGLEEDEAQKKKRPFRSLQREIIALALECNQPQEVEGTYVSLVKREPRRMEWRSGLALLYLLRGERAAAAGVFKEGLKAAGDSGKLCMRIAQAARHLSLVGEAHRAALKATRLDRDSRLQGQLFLADMAFKAGDMDAAVKRLMTVEKEYQEVDEALAQVADAYERFRRPDDAIRVLGIIEKRSTVEDVLMRLAWLLQEQKKTAEALVLWKRLWKATKLPARVRQAEDRLLDLTSNTGGLADLAIDIEESLEKGKGDARELGLLVKLYSRANDPVSAVEVLRMYASKMGKGEVETLQSMAHVYQHCEDYRRYEESLLALQKKDPENALDYQQQIAIGALERGRGRQARRALERLRKLAPGDVQAEEFSAGVLSMVGLLEDSIKAYTRVVARHPDRIEDFLLMANVMRDAGRREQALRMFLDLLERAEKDDLFTVAVDGLLNLDADRTLLRIAQRRVKERIARRPGKAFLYQLAADLAEELRDSKEQVAMTGFMVIVAGERRSSVLRELMELEAGRGNPAGLIDHGRSLLALGEEMPPQVFLDLGQALIRTGDLATAERVFARTRIAGDFVAMQQRIAGYYGDAGYVVDAARILRQALLARPTDVDLLARVGTLAEVAGDREQACRDFDLAMDILLRRSPSAAGKAQKKKPDRPGGTAASRISLSGRSPISFNYYSRNRNVDEFERFSKRVMSGLLANHRSPGTDLMKRMEVRIRQELKSLETTGQLRTALKNNPRLDRMLAFARKAAFLYGVPEVADRLDHLVLEKFPEDGGRREMAVRDRVDQGLLARARKMAGVLKVEVEKKFRTLHLDGLLKKRGEVEKLLAKVDIPASLATTHLPRLITAGRLREAKALLDEVDLKEPGVSAGAAGILVRTAIALDRSELFRKWTWRWLEAVVLKGNPRSITQQLETVFITAWGRLDARERDDLWNRLARLEEQVKEKRKAAVQVFRFCMGKRVGKTVKVGYPTFKTMLETTHKSIHSMKPILLTAPPAYLSSLFKAAMSRLPDRNRSRTQLMSFAGSFPRKMDSDMVEAVVKAFRNTRENKNTSILSTQYQVSRLAVTQNNPELAQRMIRVIRKENTGIPLFGLAEGILAHRLGNEEEGNRRIEKAVDKILKRNKFERCEEQLVNQLVTSGNPVVREKVKAVLESRVGTTPALALLIQARTLQQQGRLSDACTLLGQGYASSPDDSGIRNAYLSALKSLGRNGKVAEIRKKWLEKQIADNTYSYRILAEEYRVLDRPTLALDAIRKVKRGHVDVMEICLLRKLGRKAETRKAFRRYLAQLRATRFHAFSSWPGPLGKGGLQQRSPVSGARSGVNIFGLSTDPSRSLFWNLAGEPWALEEMECAWRSSALGDRFQRGNLLKSLARSRFLEMGRSGVLAHLSTTVEEGGLTDMDIELLLQATENGSRPLPQNLLPVLDLLRSHVLVKGNRLSGVKRNLADLYFNQGKVEEARCLYLDMLLDHFNQHYFFLKSRPETSVIEAYVRTFPEEEQENRRRRILMDCEGVLLGDPEKSLNKVDLLLEEWDRIGDAEAMGRLLAFAEKVLAMLPDHMRMRAEAVKLRGSLALHHVRKGDVDRFMALVREMLVQRLGYTRNFGFLTIRTFLPDPGKAKEAVVLARALDRGIERILGGINLARARIHLAGWLAQSGEVKEARNLIDKALPHAGDGVEDRLILADTARLINDADLAYNLERTLLERDALNVRRAPELLKEIARREGEAAADIAAIRLARHTDHPPVLVHAARAQGKAGKKKEARLILNRLKAVSPGHPELMKPDR